MRDQRPRMFVINFLYIALLFLKGYYKIWEGSKTEGVSCREAERET